MGDKAGKVTFKHAGKSVKNDKKSNSFHNAVHEMRASKKLESLVQMA